MRVEGGQISGTTGCGPTAPDAEIEAGKGQGQLQQDRAGGRSGGCGDAATGAAELGSTPIDALTPMASVGAAAPTTGAALIAQIGQNLQGAPIAEQVFAAMAANGAPVEVLSDSQFANNYGRAQGAYVPASGKIFVPQSVAANPADLQLILLHEGVHWLQDNVPGGIGNLGGAVTQALQGSGALGADASQTAANQRDEAQAYLLEAIVAQQLGLKDEGMGSDGSGALSYGETLTNVRETPEYQ